MTDLDELGGLHRHCISCYSFTLCDREEDACDFISCANDCGAVFHCCKELDHNELCPNIKVPCINAEIGCTLEMARKDTGSHLEHCVASVVICMAEWNRWPVHCSERRRAIPFRQKNPYASEGQLDFDLAMRDQRMLNGLGQLSTKTRISLRNNLTRRYPAVPLPNVVFRPPDQDDKDFLKDILDVGGTIEGVGIKVDSQLSKQMERWQKDLDDRIGSKEKPPRYWDYPEMEKGNVHKHCAYCVNAKCEKGMDFKEERACEVVGCRWNCGVVLHSCKLFEHQMICPLYETEDDFAWMYKGVGGESRKKAFKTKKAKTLLKEVESPLLGPAHPAKTPQRKKGIPEPPPMPKSVQNACRLDLKLDSVTRLQTKPRSMYTFVCAQEFRRDEIGSHLKNVHSDIIGGLNNWIEHRCPLSCYGCPFSSRRLFPQNLNQTIIYSQVSESFGVESTKEISTLMTPPQGRVGLMDLPIELHFKIFESLDSFSLRNLSLTSTILRDICCSLLDSRGCVTYQWERIRKENKWLWKIAYKRWFFSTAMTSIDHWCLTPKDDVANHLKTCPFYIIQHSSSDQKSSSNWKEVINGIKEKNRLRQLYA